nr:hypothetical protein BN167_1270079 [Clostridioides difficile E13]
MKNFSILFNAYKNFVYNYKVFNGKFYLTLYILSKGFIKYNRQLDNI